MFMLFVNPNHSSCPLVFITMFRFRSISVVLFSPLIGPEPGAGRQQASCRAASSHHTVVLQFFPPIFSAWFLPGQNNLLELHHHHDAAKPLDNTCGCSQNDLGNNHGTIAAGQKPKGGWSRRPLSPFRWGPPSPSALFLLPSSHTKLSLMDTLAFFSGDGFVFSCHACFTNAFTRHQAADVAVWLGRSAAEAIVLARPRRRVVSALWMCSCDEDDQDLETKA